MQAKGARRLPEWAAGVGCVVAHADPDRKAWIRNPFAATPTDPEKLPPDESGRGFPIFLTEIKSAGKIQAFFEIMGFKSPDSNNRFEGFDGRKLAFQEGLKIHLLHPLDPEAADWEAQKVAYGLRVARKIADQAIPRLMEQLGVTGGEVPGSGVNMQNSWRSSARINDLGGGIMAVEQIFNMDIRLQSDFEMSAGEIIFAARDTIAANIAGHAIFALEQRFEGKQSSNTNIQISRENGEIVGFEQTDAPPPPDGEPAMAA